MCRGISDKIGRRTSLQLSMIGFLFSNLFIVFFASTPIHLLIANMNSGLFYGFYWPILEAYLSETGEIIKRHDKNISFFMVSWSLGLTIGPIFGGVDWLDLKIPFYILIFVCIAAIMIVRKSILSNSEIESIKQSGDDPESENIGIETTPNDNTLAIARKNGDYHPDIKLHKKQRTFLIFTIICGATFFSFNNQIIFTLFPEYALDNLTFNTGILLPIGAKMTAAILTTAIGLMRTLSFWLAGNPKDRTKEKLMMISLGGMAISMIFVFFISEAIVLFFIFVLYGFSSGFSFVIGEILLLKLSRTGKGLKAGIYESVVGIAFFLSTFLSGFIAQANAANPYLLGGLVTLAAFFALLILYVRKQKVTETG